MIQPVVIVVELGGEVSIFESLEIAERYIEAPDVQSGENEFYGADGAVLEALVIPGSGRYQPDRVKIHRTGLRAVERLELQLRDYLTRLGGDGGEPTDLGKLIDAVVKARGYDV